MTRVAVRWNTATPLPADNRATRSLVSGATAGDVDFGPLTFEILSLISGRRLTSAQRAALLPALSEHLSGPAAPALDFGPWADADVLAAVLGIAHFALQEPADWVFVRIPEARHPTPDVWAAHGQAAPWNIELKGSAPLSGDVAHGAVLDTCGGRVFAQVRRGLHRLGTPVQSPPQRTPSISVRSIPNFGGPSHGGEAFAVSILPDVGLLGRSDIRATKRRGCPRNATRLLACRERCFQSPTPGEAAATTVLWTSSSHSAGPARGNRPTAPHGLLPSVHAVVSAAWANNQRAAAIATKRVVNHLMETEHEHAIAASSLLLGVLTETRHILRAVDRIEFVSRFTDHFRGHLDDALVRELEGECRIGVTEERDSVPIGQGAAGAYPIDVELPLASGTWRGRWAHGGLRLSAPLEALEPVLDGGRLRDLAEREVVPALKRLDLPAMADIGEGKRVALSRNSHGETKGAPARAVVGTVWWPRWFRPRFGLPDPHSMWVAEMWRWVHSWPWLGPLRASNDGRVWTGR